MGSFRLLGDLCPSLTGERAGGAGGKQRHPFSQGLCELRCLSNRGDKKHVPPLSEHSPAGMQRASQVIWLPQLLGAVEDETTGGSWVRRYQGKADTDSQGPGYTGRKAAPRKRVRAGEATIADTT